MKAKIEWLTDSMRPGFAPLFAEVCKAQRAEFAELEHFGDNDLPAIIHPTRQLEYPWALSKTGDAIDETALDIGSNPQWWAALLNIKEHMSVVGHRTHQDLDDLTSCYLWGGGRADIRPMLKRHWFDLQFVMCCPPAWGFGKDRFDYVYCLSTIEHVEQNNWEQWLEVARDSLATGGRMILTVDRMLDRADNEGHPGMWNHPIAQYFGLALPPPPDDVVTLTFPDHGRIGVYGIVVDK